MIRSRGLTLPARLSVALLGALLLGLGPVLSASAAAPAVTGVAPTGGPETGGTRVTISGTGFFCGLPAADPTTKVNFGTSAATSVTVTNDTTITAISPMGVGTVDVTVVTTVCGTSARNPADQYNYIPAGGNPSPSPSPAPTDLPSPSPTPPVLAPTGSHLPGSPAPLLPLALIILGIAFVAGSVVVGMASRRP